MLDGLLKILVDFVNFIIVALGAGIGTVLGLLPDSPFSASAPAPASINLGYITWLIPFHVLIGHYAAILAAYSIYYLYRVVLRWFKVARG